MRTKHFDSKFRSQDDMNPPNLATDSPEVFKQLVEQVKDYAIFLVDRDGIVRSWNEGARRINGYEKDEIIGKHFSTFYPQQDKDSEKPQFELRMAQEMGRYEEEGWRVRKDGSRFWANVIITPLRDAKGRLQGYAKVTRDLTQKKLQEDNFQKLLEAEERFRLLVEQVRDYAIFILDARGSIASWNQGAKRLKGYSSDEIIGKHFSIFYPPEDLAADKPTRALNIAIRESRYEDEGWRIRKDGSRFWASVVITALWDKRGNLTGFAKVTRDLTDKKKEQDELLRKTEELEAFAHTISHDLRAPLRAISSFAEILEADAKELTDKEQQVYLNKIIKSAQSMDALIADILRLSEVSLATAEQEKVALEEVIDESLSLLEAVVRKTQAVISVRKPLPLILTNRTLLIQIFSNLLTNAMKFVREGESPRIEIYSVPQGKNCEIHVRDSGVGIPPQFHKTIFNIFDRGAIEGDVSGTGIGLAIVKKAIDRIGGKVSVHSKEGEGSDFVVTLPCERPSPKAITKP